MKPKIFIGSSVEGLTIAYSIQQNLTHDAEITVWDQGVFELSQTTIESLMAILEKSDFAIFVFSPDDITKIRKKQHLTVRDNVIFELGLFTGKLGRLRTFIVIPDKPSFHIPTDLLGIVTGKYDTNRSDGSLQAATGPVCHQIRKQIQKQGSIITTVSGNIQQDLDEKQIDNENEDKEQNWVSFFLDNKYQEAIKIIETQINNELDLEQKENLIYWRKVLAYKQYPISTKQTLLEEINSEPNNVKNYISASRIFLNEDELDLSLNVINKGLECFPNNIDLTLKKSQYYEKIGSPDIAASLIIATDYTNNEDLTIMLSDIYKKMEDKNSEAAFAVIIKSYKLNPSSEPLTFRLGKLAQYTNRKNIALYLLDKLTNKYPSNSIYWGHLGYTCIEVNLPNKALEAYQKAENLSRSSWVLASIGNILKNQGLYSEARKYFDQALNMNPNDEYSHNRMSQLLNYEAEDTTRYSNLIKEGLRDLMQHQ